MHALLLMAAGIHDSFCVWQSVLHWFCWLIDSLWITELSLFLSLSLPLPLPLPLSLSLSVSLSVSLSHSLTHPPYLDKHCPLVIAPHWLITSKLVINVPHIFKPKMSQTIEFGFWPILAILHPPLYRTTVLVSSYCYSPTYTIPHTHTHTYITVIIHVHVCMYIHTCMYIVHEFDL